MRSPCPTGRRCAVAAVANRCRPVRDPSSGSTSVVRPTGPGSGSAPAARWRPEWPAEWIDWPDFRTPRDDREAAAADRGGLPPGPDRGAGGGGLRRRHRPDRHRDRLPGRAGRAPGGRRGRLDPAELPAARGRDRPGSGGGWPGSPSTGGATRPRRDERPDGRPTGRVSARTDRNRRGGPAGGGVGAARGGLRVRRGRGPVAGRRGRIGRRSWPRWWFAGSPASRWSTCSAGPSSTACGWRWSPGCSCRAGAPSSWSTGPSALTRPGAVVLDLCCGSRRGRRGAAPRRCPGIELHAVDVDPVAVRCARRNLPGRAGPPG